MKNLFKALFVAVLLLGVTRANAQISAGAGVVYGTEINNIGFSAHGNYEFNEQWSAAPSFTYFLKKDYVNWSSLDLDVNYQLTEIDNLGSLYAIGGLNMTFFKIKYDLGDYGDFDYGDYDYGDYGDELGDFADLVGYGSSSDSVTGSDTGLNLGLGMKVAAGDKMNICPEVRYTLGGANFLRIGVKVMFGL
jgi:hypothetical protein